MIRAILVIATLVSVILFPWPMSVFLALAAATVEPLTPFAAGILADTLYYIPAGHQIPLFSLCGAVTTLITIAVRSRLRTGSMRE